MRVLLLLAGLLCGCTRTYYRKSADAETYPIIAERVVVPAFDIGRTRVEPAPASRLADPTNPDRPPKPPDDPAAALFMARPGGIRGSSHWGRYGYADRIELAPWQEALPRDKDGTVRLGPESAVEVALLNSREYQTNLEDIYLAALSLTLNRFEFAMRWFGSQASTYTHLGSGSIPTESNTLTLAQRLGFNRSFAAGGQLLVDFANTYVIEFTHSQHAVMSSNLVVQLVQPLLRNAGRAVRLETLTQAERDVLYAVRTFARFRKSFWATVSTGPNGYLDLLQQVQNIRNFQANLVGQEQNLRLHEELFRGGKVSVVQVDQAFQSYQSGRVQLAQVTAAYQTSLDAFKITLGIPPHISVELDDSLLSRFQLTDPALERLRDEVDRFQRARYREIDALPTLAEIREDYLQLRELARRAAGAFDGVAADLREWGSLLAKPPEAGAEPGQRDRTRASYEELVALMPQLRRDLPALVRQLDADAAGLQPGTRQLGWEALLIRTRRTLTLVDQLVAMQTQARINRIELPPLTWEEPQALAYAHENRLDLMNALGQVTDTWRKVTVAANALRGDLNVSVTANIGTRPGSLDPFDFYAGTSRYDIGFAFDGPLNRQAERNAYRASIITYQRARRSYMALSDTVEQSVRRDLRLLNLTRLTFEATRQTLLSAARQVEAARVRILDVRNAAGTSSTLDILNALSALLQARNNLVGSYISYSQERIQLMLDLEALQLDPQGRPINERITDPAAGAGPDGGPAGGESEPELLPAPRVADPGRGAVGPAAALGNPVRPRRRTVRRDRRAGDRRPLGRPARPRR